jgi:hypothetical protein
VIIRHPIAACYSTQKWTKTSLQKLLKHWTHCHNIFLEDKKYLRNCLVLKFEDFVANSQEHLDSICRFAGIEKFENRIEIKPHTNSKYYEIWLEQRRKRTWLKRKLFDFMYRNLEKDIKKFDYSLIDL